MPQVHREMGLLQLDASKAHKRVKVHRSDWHRLLAKVKGKLFVCTSFPYGLASAQFYCGRIAGIFHRIILQTGLADWALTFVDDFLLLIEIGVLWDKASAASSWRPWAFPSHGKKGPSRKADNMDRA